MRLKYFGAVLLTIVLCFSMRTMAFADVGEISPFSDPIIHSTGITLGQGSNYKLSIIFKITAKQTAAIIGASTYDVQKYVDGAWKTVESSLTGSLTTDSISHTFSKSYSGEKDGKYRVIAYYYVKTYGGDSQTAKYTSISYTLT